MLRSISMLALLLISLSLLSLGFSPVLAEETAAQDNLTRYVDLMVGTDGATSPAATRPFGMVQLGPDTRTDTLSGYHSDDSLIYGFTHTHLNAALYGKVEKDHADEYGDILIMPMIGTPSYNSAGGDPDKGYASRFDKSTERAEPGYYAVELSDYGIGVELTASERVGLHRYQLPEGEDAYVIVDLEHRDELKSMELRIISSQILAGFRRSTSLADDHLLIYSIHFSRPIARQPRERTLSKMVVPFGKEGGELMVKVGLSTVDLNGMQRNMATEMPESPEGWDFDAYREAARNAWNEHLAKVELTQAEETQKKNFYTALYHSMTTPNLHNDTDGRYRGINRAVQRASERHQYTAFPLPATYDTLHPLFTLIEQKRAGDFAHSLLAMREHHGSFPVSELAANEIKAPARGLGEGYAVAVIADAQLKGIGEFDAEALLAALPAGTKASSTEAPCAARLNTALATDGKKVSYDLEVDVAVRSEQAKKVLSGSPVNSPGGYVLGALGLQPLDACSPYWVVVPPLVEQSTLQLENGKSWTVRREGTGTQIKAATLNGEALEEMLLHHDQITAGGELIVKVQ